MNLLELVKKEDVQFYKKCVTCGLGERYFSKIKYDKTLNLRNDEELFNRGKDSKKQIEEIRRAVQNIPGIVACRITGSAVVDLCGAAEMDCKEEVTEDGITLTAVPQEKKPDIDIEMVVDDYGFVESDGYALLNERLRAIDKNGLRISLGLIDYRTVCKYSVRNVIRWGFLKSEVILTGVNFYKREQHNAWKYMDTYGRRKEFVQLVGVRHLYYSFKGLIRYYGVEKIFLSKEDFPEIFLAVDIWESTHTDLFFKEDYE